MFVKSSCLLLSRDKNPAFNPMASDPHGSWTASAPPVEGESDTLSNAQRSALKWEKEEALGEMATVAPVLYTNINFPSLKEEFPGECWVCCCTLYPSPPACVGTVVSVLFTVIEGPGIMTDFHPI